MPKIIGVDGVERSADDEEKLNLSCVALFERGAGKEVMAWLRSITVNRAYGPNATDAELRHLEGQRYLVGLISQRIKQGHKAKTNVASRTEAGGRRTGRHSTPV